MNSQQIFIPVQNKEDLPKHLIQFADYHKIEFCDVNSDDIFALHYTNNRLGLKKLDEPLLGEIVVDFLAANVEYRRKFGGGRNETIAKAVGFKKGAPSVLDATAGLGRDSFVLASCGSKVHLLERNPFIALLLVDGIERASQDGEIGDIINERFSFEFQNSFKSKKFKFKPDVVYLDPMYPNKKKSALVKKEMRILQDLLGPDEDSEKLLEWAMNIASKKVVVKRPLTGNSLTSEKPNDVLKSKKNRFDIYIIK